MIIVALLVAVNRPVDFITEHSCWCSVGGVLFWTFVAIIGLILLVRLFPHTLKKKRFSERAAICQLFFGGKHFIYLRTRSLLITNRPNTNSGIV